MYAKSVYGLVLLCAFAINVHNSPAIGRSWVYAQDRLAKFPDAHDRPIEGWQGPVFKLSQDYPATLPPAEAYPWLQLDFRAQPLQYMQAVLSYIYEGNLDVDWDVEKNKIRSWYHAPWMHYGHDGREFVHGLTRERASRPGELDPHQRTHVQNWGFSVYNAPGGYVIGRVWADPDRPNPAASVFPDGTVSVKLLFSHATLEEVPYLKGSKEWQAHIYESLDINSNRTIQTLRLLQIDFAVRDSRADPTTGWIFGTFVYHAHAKGSIPWDRMLPIGLMWGNDPGVTPEMVERGVPIKEAYLNPDLGKPQYLGWAGRLNGPIDNPVSSCLSCHSTAQFKARSPMFPPPSMTDNDKLRWFRNIRAGEPFDAGQQSLDYSLQLAAGIQNFYKSKNEGVPPKSVKTTKERRITRDDGDPEKNARQRPAETSQGAGPENRSSSRLSGRTVIVMVAILGGLLAGMVVIFRKRPVDI